MLASISDLGYFYGSIVFVVIFSSLMHYLGIYIFEDGRKW